MGLLTVSSLCIDHSLHQSLFSFWANVHSCICIYRAFVHIEGEVQLAARCSTCMIDFIQCCDYHASILPYYFFGASVRPNLAQRSFSRTSIPWVFISYHQSHIILPASSP